MDIKPPTQEPKPQNKPSDNQPEQAEPEEPELTQPIEPATTPQPEAEQIPINAEQEKRKWLVFAVVATVVLAGLALLTYFMVFNSSDEQEPADDNDTGISDELPVNDDSTEDDSAISRTDYESVLYPGIVFSLFDGWTLEEPADYEGEDFPASADLVLKNGDFEVTIPFMTAIAAGFTQNYCYADPDYVTVLEAPERTYIRYERDNQFVVVNAQLKGTDEFNFWVNGDGSEFIAELDENPDFCHGDEPIAIGIESTVASDPEVPQWQDSNGDGFVDAWMMRITTNNTNATPEQLNELDTMLAEVLQDLN